MSGTPPADRHTPAVLVAPAGAALPVTRTPRDSSLQDAVEGDLRIERVGQDSYGRTLAMVTGARGDLSCWPLSQRQAEYRAAWNDGLRVARTCPSTLFGKRR